MKEYLKEFWELSYESHIERFDFCKFFTECSHILYEKLALHGMLDFEAYMSCIQKYYDLTPLKQYEYKATHPMADFGLVSILKGIFYQRYLHHRTVNTNNRNYQDLLKLYKELNYILSIFDDVSIQDKVILVDKCIHAIHRSGKIIKNFEEIKKESDDEILKIHKRRLNKNC